MRTYALTIAAAAFFALPTSAFSQNVELRPGGIRIEPGYHGRSVTRLNFVMKCGKLVSTSKNWASGVKAIANSIAECAGGIRLGV